MIFLYIVIFVMPLARHPIWSGMVGDITVVKYIGAAASFYALLHLAARTSRPRFFRTGQARWFLCLALLAMSSYLLLGEAVPFGISPFLSYLSFLQLFFVTLVVTDSLRRLRMLLLVTIASLGMASLYVLREWQNMGFAFGYRPGWITGDPNYFSNSAVLGLPLAWCLLQTRLKRWEWWLCLGCLSLTLLAFTAASSRGGFLGLVAALMMIGWRARERAKAVAIGLALLLPLLLLSPSSPLSRLLSPNSGDEQATENRIATWKAGLAMIKAEPMTGVGVGNFKLALRMAGTPEDSIYIAHNTYIQIAAELGIPGLIAFVAVIFCSIRTLERVRTATAASRSSLVNAAAHGIQVGLVGFAVASFFVSAEYQKLFWFLIFLSMCLPSLGESPRPDMDKADRREIMGPRSRSDTPIGLTIPDART